MRVVMDEGGQPVQEKTDRRTGKVYRYPVAAGKVPEDWWTDIETLNRGDAERTGWPTQKPVRLLERIIGAASAPDALVADWFCGSGTTAVAARRLGRRFLCVDAAPEAIACAAARLGEAAGVAIDYWPNSSRNEPPRPPSGAPAGAGAASGVLRP
jgi:DNA modification methylase